MSSLGFWALFFGTFALEDAAVVSGLAQVSRGSISPTAAFWALSLGIALGDLGLYWIGRRLGAWSQIAWIPTGLRRYSEQLEIKAKRIAQSGIGDGIIFGARAVPGARVPSYVGAGLADYPIYRFVAVTVISVGLWVVLALTFGALFLSRLKEASGNLLLAAILTFAAFVLMRSFLARMRDPWLRKAALKSVPKWRHFEFWPAWLFYIPVVPYVIFLVFRYRSLRAPLAVNPGIKNGGWVGESKWDFLSLIEGRTPHALSAFLAPEGISEGEVVQRMDEKNLGYPLVLKPDVGQRGFGVRIVRNQDELRRYLSLARGATLFQRLSTYDNEAGVFYYRHPNEDQGRLFSITLKSFPAVTGDGKHRLGDLILSDPRAGLIASTYFARLKEKLNTVPARGETVRLVECGNHCQGAIFTDGSHLLTEELRREIDAVAKWMPNFYFGRIDLRFRDVQSLSRGEDFEIIEVNGAGSEATHIWDARCSLGEAYRSLFAQWNLLFQIGSKMELQKTSSIFSLLIDCAKLLVRGRELGVSS